MPFEGITPEPSPRKGPGWLLRHLAALVLIPALAGAALALAPALAMGTAANEAHAVWDELDDTFDLDHVLPGYTTVVDSGGEQIAQFYSENRVPLTRDEIPDAVVDALVATEDASFFDHAGIDPYGIARALVSNVTSDSRQGGSTITQQLVENVRLLRATSDEEAEQARAGSAMGKLQEMRYALALERAHTKDEILTAYLNTVYFGSRTYGLATAAHRHFSVQAHELSAPQAALLVGMLRSPTNYNPFTNPQAAKDRRDTVLWRMQQAGYLTEQELAEHSEEPLGLAPGEFDSGCGQSDYPYYCSLVLDELLTNPAFGESEVEREALLYRGNITVHTALDAGVVEAAQEQVQAMLGSDNEYKTGVAIITPGTGQLLAVAQNTSWEDTEVVYADSPQQTGSAFKPIVLAAAFNEGVEPSLVLNGSAPYYSSLDNPPRGFVNAVGGGSGRMDARTATRLSNNIYFVRLTERVGVRQVAQVGRDLGLPLPADLTGQEASIALGAYESSPIQTATAYATFASGGIRCQAHTITAVVDELSGSDLPAPDGQCQRVLSSSVAAAVTDLLTEPLTQGGTAEEHSIGRAAAGKTGSTNNWSVANFAGFTPQQVTALWVADPSGPNSNPLRNVRLGGAVVPNGYAGVVAAPIWSAIMQATHQDLPAEPLRTPHPSYQVGHDATVEPAFNGLSLDGALALAGTHGLEVAISEQTEPDAAGLYGPGVVSGGHIADGVVHLVLTPGSDIDHPDVAATGDQGEEGSA